MNTSHFRFKTFLDGRDIVCFMDDTPKFRQMKRGIIMSLKMYGEELARLEKITLEIIEEVGLIIWHKFPRY